MPSFFNVPRKTLLHCGLVGVIGWIIYYILTEQGMDVVKASFFGSFVIAIVAHLYARRFKIPMIIFIVGGIIPLVPGGMAYNAMRNVVEDDYLQGLQYGLKAFFNNRGYCDWAGLCRSNYSTHFPFGPFK
ncbi:threonine/serine exporter family protein [Lysinibacillus sp. MHQ-1]|nr:threonine/serine exporter family protein [Lysinibacillus sp. MHQ-1]